MRTAIELFFRLFWHPIHFGIICLFLVFLFLPCNMKGQILFHDTEEKVGKEQMIEMFNEAKCISDSLFRLRNDSYLLDIMYWGNNLILFVNGYFNVYLWKTNSWQQRNQPRKGGYNFGSKKFIWNNRIFSFGGFGNWYQHGDLIEFDIDSGKWRKVELNRTLPMGIMYTTPFGFRLLSDAWYEVNLKKQTVKKLDLDYPDKIDMKNVIYGTKIENANWAFLFQGGSNMALHKLENKIYYSNNSTFEVVTGFLFNHNEFVHSKRDSVILWAPNGTILKGFNIREHLTHYKKIDLHTKNESVFNLFLYATLILGLSIALYFWNNLKIKHRSKTDIWQNQLVPVLMNLSGTQVTTEQLDKMLDIDDITPLENKKYKRSRLLQEMNKEYEIKVGKTLITRLKDPDDGRKFIYKISTR